MKERIIFSFYFNPMRYDFVFLCRPDKSRPVNFVWEYVVYGQMSSNSPNNKPESCEIFKTL